MAIILYLFTLSSPNLLFVSISLYQRRKILQTLPSSISTIMVDRISNLSDELLCHILSFIPTKLAFTTTVLSKRWTSLCYSLPVLDFEYGWEDSCYQFDRFCRNVDAVMLSPLSTNQPLQTFYLKCYLRDQDHISRIFNAWIEAAKRRHVEEIILTLNFHILNPTIFISRTLVVLKLKRIHVTIDTLCVDLPSLQTLHLKYVDFKNWNDYINFLSFCPILLDLHAECIYIRSGMNLEEGLRSLTLSTLVRASISSMDALFNGIDNVEFLRIITRFGSTEASLEAIPMFTNLTHIELLFFYNSFHCWDGVVELLRNCPNLQILFITKVCKIKCLLVNFFSIYFDKCYFLSLDSGPRPTHPRN